MKPKDMIPLAVNLAKQIEIDDGYRFLVVAFNGPDAIDPDNVVFGELSPCYLGGRDLPQFAVDQLNACRFVVVRRVHEAPTLTGDDVDTFQFMLEAAQSVVHEGEPTTVVPEDLLIVADDGTYASVRKAVEAAVVAVVV